MASFWVVLDCRDPDRLAEFYCAAFGYLSSGTAANYRSLDPVKDPSDPKLLLQGVTEQKAGKNRMHLDLLAGDIEQEAARLVELGATRLVEQAFNEHGMSWIVLADPEGNELCVIKS